MQQHTRRLMVYDICCKKRLQKVHKRCTQDAISMQNSVFLFQGSLLNWTILWADLQKIIDITSDSFWIFELDQSLYFRQLGCKPLPDGILVLGEKCLHALII